MVWLDLNCYIVICWIIFSYRVTILTAQSSNGNGSTVSKITTCLTDGDCIKRGNSVCIKNHCICKDGTYIFPNKCLTTVTFPLGMDEGKQTKNIWISIVLPVAFGFIALLLIVIGVCQLFRIRRKRQLQTLQHQASLSQFWTEMPASVRATLQEPPNENSNYDIIINQNAVEFETPHELLDEPPAYEEIIKEKNEEDDLPPNYWKAIRNIVNDVYGSKRSRHGSMRCSQTESDQQGSKLNNIVDYSQPTVSNASTEIFTLVTANLPSSSSVDVHSERNSRRSISGLLSSVNVPNISAPAEQLSFQNTLSNNFNNASKCESTGFVTGGDELLNCEVNSNLNVSVSNDPLLDSNAEKQNTAFYQISDSHSVICRSKSAEIPRKNKQQNSDENLEFSFRRSHHRNSDSALSRKFSLQHKFSNDCNEDFKRNEQKAYHLFSPKCSLLSKSTTPSYSWTHVALTTNTPPVLTPLPKSGMWYLQNNQPYNTNKRKREYSKSLNETTLSAIKLHKRSFSSDSSKMNRLHNFDNSNSKNEQNNQFTDNVATVFSLVDKKSMPNNSCHRDVEKLKGNQHKLRCKHKLKVDKSSPQLLSVEGCDNGIEKDFFKNALFTSEQKSSGSPFEIGLPILKISKKPHSRYRSETSLLKKDDTIHRRTLSEEIVPQRHSQALFRNENYSHKNSSNRLIKAKSMETSLAENSFGCKYFKPCNTHEKLNQHDRRLSCDDKTVFCSENLKDNIEDLIARKSTNMEVNTNDLHMTSCLGKGYYGEVWKAVLYSQTVAVKWLKIELLKVRANELLMNIKTMKALDHPNLVKLLALSQDPVPQIITEYLHLGSLWAFLKKHDQILTLSQLVKYCLDIVKGMIYLEENHIIHRDLMTRNILMVSESWVKISDYFLSQSVIRDPYISVSADQPILLYWFAPECILEGKFSHQSDVWSLGVTLWEIFSYGDNPILCHQEDLIVCLWEGNRLLCPSASTTEIYNQMLSCWNWMSSQRSTFYSLLTCLQRSS